MSIYRVINCDTLQGPSMPVARRVAHIDPLLEAMTILLGSDDTDTQEKRDMIEAIKEKLSAIYRPDNEEHSISLEAYSSTIDFLDRAFHTLRFMPEPRFNRSFDAGVDLCWRSGTRKVVIRVPYDGGEPRLYMKKGDGESVFSETIPAGEDLRRDIEWAVGR